MSFGFDVNFEQPFLGGGSSVGLAANRAYPASLNGVPYMFDTKEQFVTHASAQELRAAQDQQGDVGRNTLNPEAFWRRTFESWHVGAGQNRFDRPDASNPYRFKRSKGVDIWTSYQISLLKDTDEKRNSANSNLRMAVAGGFLYLTDGTALLYTQDITIDTPTWTTVTGGTAATFSQIASDGFNVLLATGASGIDKTTRGAATKTNHITGTVAEVFYGKGRWLAAQDNNLYDITTLVAGGGALPTALFSHSNTDYDWVAFAEGPQHLYAAGFSGDKSLIYRLSLKEDGTGLNQPVVAGFLPDGEIVKSMQGYAGFVLIGTTKGVRVAVPGGNGDLTIGAAIPTDDEVLAFEGQGNHVWFGWTRYEGGASGLGRLSLETFSDIQKLAPAFASDLIITSASQGAVRSVATFQNIRVFTVSGAGVWAEHLTNLVATGEVESGAFDYGLADPKLSLFVDSAHTGPHSGAHSFSMSVDSGAFTSLGTVGSDHQPLGTGEARGQEFSLKLVMTRDSGNNALGPTVSSFAMRVEPITPLVEIIEAPLLIAPEIKRLDLVVENVDSIAQAENLQMLRRTKQVTTYTEGGRGWSVIVLDYILDEHDIFIASDEALGINGRCLVKMKVVV